MTLPHVAKISFAAAIVLCAFSALWAAEERPIDGIQDDSFLIEEAYNQEPNVIQHTFTAAYNNDSRARGWTRSARAFKPTLSPGFRTAVMNEEKLQIVVGAAMPVGVSHKADNHGAFLYFSVEHDLF